MKKSYYDKWKKYGLAMDKQFYTHYKQVFNKTAKKAFKEYQNKQVIEL